MFKGTFDGFGHKITYKSSQYGIFGGIQDATIKNLKIIDTASTCGITLYKSLLCLDIMSSQVENVIFEATGVASGLGSVNTSLSITAQGYGWVSCRITQDSSFVNCVLSSDFR